MTGGGAPAVTVTGLRELRRGMKAAGIALTELRDLNRAAADTVAPHARSAAPVRSGRLAASVRAGASQRAAIIRVGRASIPYAAPIHWGWPARGIRPQPFAADAARTAEPAWVEIYFAGVRAILDRVASSSS